MKPFDEPHGEPEPLRIYFIGLTAEERKQAMEKFDAISRAFGAGGMAFTLHPDLESEADLAREFMGTPEEILNHVIVMRRRHFDVLINLSLDEVPRFFLPEDLN